MDCEWNDKIFSVTAASFESLALEVFQFQYGNNPIYKLYVDALKIPESTVNKLAKIPFLPINFFKSHQVTSGNFEAQAIFESSGTGNLSRSKHFVKDLSIYLKSFTKGFENFYGSIEEYCILGVLPSYQERKNSSLVFMVNELMKLSKHSGNAFYLNEGEQLFATLQMLEKTKQKVLLIGVTFALLDFAEKKQLALSNTIIMETGGMKGRREELTRDEVHQKLKKSFGVAAIHSEYGMTELLSQAYSFKNGIFNSPPWMKVMIRDEEDPLLVREKTNAKQLQGALNIIDLANVHSCSFIATEDIGRLYTDGSFEVLGRMDETELRGCSQLVLN